MAYIKPYSPAGAALTDFSQLLMQFLTQAYQMKMGQKQREEDKSERAKEFATTTGMEQQKIDLERKRMTDDAAARDLEQRIRNAGIAVDQTAPGTQSPDQAALLRKMLEGTPYAARLQTSGQEGTLPSTQMSPDATGGLRKEQNPGGVTTSLIPTFQQRQQQDVAEMQAQQFKSEQETAALQRQHLSGEYTDAQKSADEFSRLAKEHGYRMDEIRAQLQGGKKTSIDDDVKMVIAARAAADKETDPVEAANLKALASAMTDITEKKWGISLRAPQDQGPQLPDEGPKKVTVPTGGGINYPAAIKDFLTGGGFTPTRGGGPPDIAPAGGAQDALGRLLRSAQSSVMDCPKNDPRYLTDPTYCKPHIEPAK